MQHRRQAKTESLRLLSTMLAIPGWGRSLDLDSEEALSLTSALLREEAVALNRAADGETMTKVTPFPTTVPWAVSCAIFRVVWHAVGVCMK